jgi:hypothetical protein
LWLWELRLRRRRKNRPAIRFAQDPEHFNNPSAIRSTLFQDRARPLGVKRPDQRQSLKAVAETRHRFAACGLDRLPLPRQALAERSRLTMSEPFLSRPGNQHRFSRCEKDRETFAPRPDMYP